MARFALPRGRADLSSATRVASSLRVLPIESAGASIEITALVGGGRGLQVWTRVRCEVSGDRKSCVFAVRSDKSERVCKVLT